MRKVFSIFVFVFIYTALTFGQAAVDIPITISDNQGGFKVLYVGLDLTATVGIDTHLGEGILPPFPPPGAFDTRWNLQPFGGGNFQTYKDYRGVASFPYTGTVTHRLLWQYTDLATQLSIGYVLPPQARLLITSNNATPIWSTDTLSGTGTYVLPDPDNEYTAARVYLIYDAILPVELLSFGASVSGNNVNLNWQTGTEVNNMGFEVERKSPNSSWEKIGFVGGAGNSTSVLSYTFTDENLTGTSYKYRLKQIDFDGTYNYSNEVEVDLNVKDFNLYQNYPNPFNPSTTVRFSVPQASFVNVKIYNMLGQEITTLFSEDVNAGVQTLNWNGKDNNGNDMSSGSYICRMTAGDFSQSVKMILMK